MNPSARYFTQKSIIEYAGGVGARLKLAHQSLDNLGYMNLECVIQNSSGILKQLKAKLE